MGIVVRNNHGTEYLYFPATKSQLFLSKKADLNSLNPQNLQKGIELVKTFDNVFVKYLQGIHCHAGDINPSERKKYHKKELMI